MAKAGIDSFLLDCRTNDKISELEVLCGVKGFAVVIRLWQKIYSERGYYCEWTDRSAALFLAKWFVGNSGVTVNLITDVVERCLSIGIFDDGMYRKYSVLTSARIQTQYLNYVKRREKILVKKEYLLVSVDKIEGIVYENDISVCKNAKNADRNGTTRLDNTKDIYCAPEPHNNTADKNEQLETDFEIIYAIYPKKRGRTGAFDSYKAWVGKGKNIGGKRYRLTNRQIYLAIKKYIRQQEEAGQDDLTYWKNFDTLMGRQLLDYVDLGDGKG